MDIIVIGGGPSGLMAAGRAAECGATVLLLEKMGKVGIKLALTGKGRCNLTNGGDLPSFIASYRRNGKFLHNAFSRFFNDDLIAFFHRHGLPTLEERGRRIFPASNRAQDVVRVLRENALKKGVRLTLRTPVQDLRVEGGRVTGVRTERETLPASRVILATGGASYAETGSTGDGFRMAAAVGHTVQPIRPALVPLETVEPVVRDLQGLALKNVRVTIFAGGRSRGDEFGELLFTHFGVSGPIILTLSGSAVEEAGKGKVELSIDFKPALSPEQLDRRLLRELQENPRMQIGNILNHLLPAKLAPLFSQTVGISREVRGAELRVEERKHLGERLKDWRLTVKRPRPIEEAIITAGGVAVKEIHPSTMESKIVPGLYFCGEVIDVDGKTGGYNLQEAFSTGWVAGEAAARG